MVFIILFLVSTVCAQEPRSYKDIIPPDTCAFKSFDFFTQREKELNKLRKKYSDRAREYVRTRHPDGFPCDAPYADAQYQEMLKVAAQLSELNLYDIILKYGNDSEAAAFYKELYDYIYVTDCMSKDYFKKLRSLLHELHHYKHDCHTPKMFLQVHDVALTNDEYKRYREMAADTDSFERALVYANLIQSKEYNKEQPIFNSRGYVTDTGVDSFVNQAAQQKDICDQPLRKAMLEVNKKINENHIQMLHWSDAELKKLPYDQLKKEYEKFSEYRDTYYAHRMPSESDEDVLQQKQEALLLEYRELQFQAAFAHHLQDSDKDLTIITCQLAHINCALKQQAFDNARLYTKDMPEHERQELLYPFKAEYVVGQNMLIELLGRDDVQLYKHDVNMLWVNRELNIARLERDEQKQAWLEKIKASYVQQAEQAEKEAK